ncbi:fungal specific transcription factor domain containing protein [Grosmannia clavigera kw1407]|uniref:Fungal specific transcription factor domain containing protein n=1 Tax=Grosmannia clavigera (strain kw1407 / UAMH 11150) TaxID=655863 RepID=F0XGT6_GROCL|nr:fungal specific transcription factor domain containing protein [Grosmannia clavigera kw1407]EFX03274.1 fungal specific transcription factor domain containing protein [Grosmannia clavigera kw1407]
MSRPQVGIERLPTRRLTNEPRESMNCKSCRKRKRKLIGGRYRTVAIDAVPKKRGPKTDVLEALLKRVDGLEQQLKDKKKEDHSNEDESGSSGTSKSGSGNGPSPSAENDATASSSVDDVPDTIHADVAGTGTRGTSKKRKNPLSSAGKNPVNDPEGSVCDQLPQSIGDPNPVVQTEALLETSTPHPNGYQAAVSMGEAYVQRARAEIEMDEPTVDGLQALLLLTLSFNASGKGKKAYMLLTSAIGMALALELHREMDVHIRIMPAEREMRRRLFWTSYLLDRFMACGSRRPSLIGDRNILLRLPCWSPSPNSMPVEGDFFQSDSNLQYLQGGGGGKKSQGSSGMLIDITRILGITNQYMAAGGVKGDSHFPWHSLSNLSKIRHDLDVWASGTQDIFSSVASLFSQPDSTSLVLSKLVYHLIHCLIYRPFLPVDLAELAGTGQHQSWQIEATNMCFLHANAVAELVELGKQMPDVEWPGFVGYCICTAGTVHIHGAHYNKGTNSNEMSVFASSAEFLSREMQQLNELRYAWAVVQHHRQTLQMIYNTHTELIKSLATNPMRYTSVFHLDDFFDRYSNITGPASLSSNFDSANLSLTDIVVDYAPDQHVSHDLYMSKLNLTNGKVNGTGSSSSDIKNNFMNAVVDRPNLKRKLTGTVAAPNITASNSNGSMSLQAPRSISIPGQNQQPYAVSSFLPPSAEDLLASPGSMAPVLPHSDSSADCSHTEPQSPTAKNARFSQQQQQQSSATTFSPEFNFSALASGPSTAGGTGGGLSGYDPMFGTLQENTFPTPSLWPPEDDTGSIKAVGVLQSPGGQSNGDSVGGTTASEEKDPFLSLLEQFGRRMSMRVVLGMSWTFS